MELIKCRALGVATKHGRGEFHRDHEGKPSWLIMCFNTDFVYGKDSEIKHGKKDECIIHAPNAPIFHGPEKDAKEGFENDWMYFSGEGMEELIQSLGLPINENFFVDDSNCLTYYLTQIINEDEMPSCYSDIYISSIIYQMLVNIARRRKSGEYKNDETYEIIKKTRIFMLEHYYEKFTLKRLSEMAGYSVSRFCEIYKIFYNESPIKELVDMRIRKAKYYIIFTNYSVSEIAARCGFESIHYFSNIFKQKTGSSPLEYRKYLMGIDNSDEQTDQS